jgi:hypothetical protein
LTLGTAPEHRERLVSRCLQTRVPQPNSGTFTRASRPKSSTQCTAYWRKHAARYQELAGLAEEFLRAEHEYWRVLELLSGHRQHFKPGLSDETRSFDDEVAA